MPRTKQRRTKRSHSDYEQVVRDFKRLVNLRIHKVELEFKSMQQQMDTTINLALSRYPEEVQNLTLRDLLTPDESPKKENLPPKTPKIPKESKSSIQPPKSTQPKRPTAASDDGYQSESRTSRASQMKTTSRRSRSTNQRKTKTRRSRSISQDQRSKSQLNVTNTKKMKQDLMRTPTCKTSNTFVITPKVKLNAAINIMRKPKDGEMVFSTQGSPLLVSKTVSENTANINVPMRNGNIVSLLPFNETSLTDNLHFDEDTLRQLKILRGHLDKVLK